MPPAEPAAPVNVPANPLSFLRTCRSAARPARSVAGAVRLATGFAAAALGAAVIAKRQWLETFLEVRDVARPAFRDIMPAALWPGFLGAALILAALSLTAHWWAGPWPAAMPGAVARAPRWFPRAVAVLLVAGTAVRAPRLGLSLYNDEAHVFRLHLGGAVPAKHAGHPEEFREASWLATLYENRATNNSMPFSALSRGSHELWRRLTGAPPGVICEPALRLPVMICGVLSIAAMGCLGLQLGGVWTGLAAAVLTTFHPWHVRYSVEARNYGMLMLAVPLLFLALHRALRTGSWRAWLGFSLAQYFCMALFLGVAHFLTALNLSLAGVALWPAVRDRSLRAISWPLLVPAVTAGLLAAAVYLAVNFPLLWQSAHFLGQSTVLHGSFSAGWFADVGSLLTFGIPARDDDPANPSILSIARLTAQSPALTWTAIALVAAGLATGFRDLLRGGATGTILAVSCIGGGALTLFLCSLQGLRPLTWYNIYLLPGAVLMVAAGVVRLAGSLGPGLRTTLCLGALMPAVVWGRAVHGFAQTGRENLRAVVEAAHGAPYPAWRDNSSRPILRVLWSESTVYDLAAVLMHSDDDLEAAIGEARATGRDLYVECGSPAQVEQVFPGIFAHLNNPAEFELLDVFHGLDAADTTHRVYRLRREALRPADTRTTSTPAADDGVQESF